ncbi:MAG TPA: superoxide dismutase [Gemmataceae bacterium]|nr:superoxide dismutase [Gemmataceae bacterium]
MAYTLPPLPYPPDSLEPSIDKMTMEIHHDRHHKAYVDNVNKALEGQTALQNLPIEHLLREINKVPENIRQAVINNGGGHANHTMFWEIMAKGAGGKPSGPLADEISKTFGDFTAFQQQLKQAAVSRFGSGWAWLVVDGGKLQILSTPNQDSPYMKNQAPIMGVDVWEHAYYLKYQNKRPDYIDAWWAVANWSAIAERFSKAKAGTL